MMSSCRAILIGVVVACHYASASATNIKFMPGDAFFPSRLTKDVAEKLTVSTDEFQLRYEPPPNRPAYLCGYAGYVTLQIDDVPNSWPEQINEVYTALRYRRSRQVAQGYDAAGNINLENEENGFWMLVYNKGFNPERYRLGLRYNEKWFDPLPGGESTFQKIIVSEYVSHLSSPTAIVEDWRNAARVEELQVKYPDLGERQAEVAGDLIETPVTASAKDVRIIVIPEQDLDAYLNLTGKAFGNRRCNFVVFDKDGVWQYYVNSEGALELVPWKREIEVKWPSILDKDKDDEVDTDDAESNW